MNFDVLHLPGTRLIAVSSDVSARPGRIDNAALFTRFDLLCWEQWADTTVLHTESPDIHALAADAYAAIAKNAAWTVEVNHQTTAVHRDGAWPQCISTQRRRRRMSCPATRARRRHRTQAIERMVAEQQQTILCAPDESPECRSKRHALGDRRSARGLQLRHLFDFDEVYGRLPATTDWGSSERELQCPLLQASISKDPAGPPLYRLP